jgi:hypothetical protein
VENQEWPESESRKIKIWKQKSRKERTFPRMRWFQGSLVGSLGFLRVSGFFDVFYSKNKISA